jgi:hypothetical protein
MAGNHNRNVYEAHRAISLGLPQAPSPRVVPLEREDAYYHIQLRLGSVELYLRSPIRRHIVALSRTLPSAWDSALHA